LIPAGCIGIFHWHKILPITLWPWVRLSIVWSTMKNLELKGLNNIQIQYWIRVINIPNIWYFQIFCCWTLEPGSVSARFRCYDCKFASLFMTRNILFIIGSVIPSLTW